MENNEMFLPSKLTSQKTRIKYLSIAIIVPIIGIVLVLTTWNSCGIDHVTIVSDISKYYETLDPEFCESLVYRIDTFNEQCSPEIEILDCG